MARPRKFDEAEVLRAAREQFWTGGYEATSLDDLTAATGLGRGSLYGAFGDKHSLFLRAFDGYCTDAVAGVEADLTGPGRAYDRLVAHLRTAAASSDGGRGCLLAKSTAELAGDDPAVAERARATFLRLHELLTDTVTAAQREGDLDPAADPAKLAAVVLAALRGMESVGKAGVGPDLLRAIADQTIALLPRP
ncbi:MULTISPECIES: TetR/AcrR family transcriptional regulator [Catellatospora]|uniref:TetR family transcriptional regulator n=1 Tax=Catellatospora chokoriensis TaxID=310353 RepID=A0A8J3K5T3_9ACTN|nr:TetR/AcrR family transcriptional regulator [Catellatospora chokoriensis]GIF90783.1 TetR family transcriptional regulator [Catellatospora chokoriensis]